MESERNETADFDLTQFHQVFFEEAAEHLARMETLLVGIDSAAPENDDLDAIFRTAHSLKGGAAAFGFDEMTELTHELESMLDKVRKHELGLSGAMVDVLLEAGDMLKLLIARYSGESAAAEVPVASMCARIRECMAAAQPPSSSPRPSAAAFEPVVQKSAGRALEVAFTLAPASASIDLGNLQADLARLGTLAGWSPPPSAGAPTYRFGLTTAANDGDIIEALAFVADPATITITAVMPDAGAHADDKGPDNAFFAAAMDLLTGSADKTDGGTAKTDVRPASAAQQRTAPAAASVASPAPTVRRDPAPVPGTAESSSIRVGIEKVDQLINLVGELVITQAMLAQQGERLDPVKHEKLLQGLGQLERNTRNLQESVMSVRMMPIAMVFNRFPRVVRDLAAKLEKEVELRIEGEGTELDKGLIEKISDPLTHLVRNSLDHGIETPEKRRAAGKPARGTILLRAFHQGGNIVIEVTDDGAGLNREKILEKARARGLAVDDGMPDQDVWQLIFEAGFSTADTVTDVSGRGVGMDVVKRNIQALGGRVEIDSSPGLGARIAVRLPLTLAILDGMSIGVGDQIFIVALNHVVESLQVSTKDLRTVSGKGRVISVRGDYLPVLALHELFNITPKAADYDHGIMVILESDGGRAAFFVDELLGQHQVVIKSLETNYRKVPGVSGATIMGDGRVALILDVAGLVKMSRH
ncbi:MAG TPA: chemotaxis protein CheW [Burkholderiales bacterium]|nr:chemotaxis protein CheW [Burkholderiales bacterium]